MGGSGQAGYSKRSRLDKLGVKPGARIAVVGLDDAGFLAELRGRTSAVASGRVPKAADLIFIYMDRTADLPRLEKARRAIAPNGAVWVIWPKGRKAFREDDVRACVRTDRRPRRHQGRRVLGDPQRTEARRAPSRPPLKHARSRVHAWRSRAGRVGSRP